MKTDHMNVTSENTLSPDRKQKKAGNRGKWLAALLLNAHTKERYTRQKPHSNSKLLSTGCYEKDENNHRLGLCNTHLQQKGQIPGMHKELSVKTNNPIRQ